MDDRRDNHSDREREQQRREESRDFVPETGQLPPELLYVPESVRVTEETSQPVPRRPSVSVGQSQALDEIEESAAKIRKLSKASTSTATELRGSPPKRETRRPSRELPDRLPRSDLISGCYFDGKYESEEAIFKYFARKTYNNHIRYSKLGGGAAARCRWAEGVPQWSTTAILTSIYTFSSQYLIKK